MGKLTMRRTEGEQNLEYYSCDQDVKLVLKNL